MWDDLVVRGVVAGVEYTTVPAEEWHIPAMLEQLGHAPVEVMRVVLRVEEVLRGPEIGPEVVLVSLRFRDVRRELNFVKEVKAGAKVLATASLLAQPAPPRWIETGVFVASGEGWSRCAYHSWEKPVSDEEVRRRIKSVGVHQMTRDSDLVLVGTVSGREPIATEGGRWETYVVRPTRLVKGSVEGEIVVRVLRTVKPDAADWRSFVTFALDEAPLWYLFLQKQGDHYTLTAGRRSTIAIRDGVLFESLSCPSRYSPEGLEREVRAITSDQ